MNVAEKSVRPLTGWHVLAMFVAFFSVVIAVNIGLAWKAISTFPGLEVEDSYVASQSFDADMAAQKALHWVMKPVYDATAHRMELSFVDASGVLVTLKSLDVLIGRTTETTQDQRPGFAQMNGVYRASVDLAFGKWMMAVDAVAADGTGFHQRIDLYVNR